MDNACLAIISGKLGFADADLQRQDIRAYAASFKMPVAALVDSAKFQNLSFTEVAVKLSKVQQAAIVVWRIDCLPSAVLNLENLVELLAVLSKNNISFISVQDGIDTDDTPAKFLPSLSRAWGHYKTNRKVVNARASLQKAALKKPGFRTGRPKKRDDLLIRRLSREGFSIRQIAARTKVSAKSVQRSLEKIGPVRPLDKSL